MTISELRKKYKNGELTSTQGDQEFRYLALSPLFTNLYENKVVYHDRFTSIIRLEDLEISPIQFQATAIRHLLIDNGAFRRKRLPPEKWEISANWAYLRLAGSSLCVYSGWVIWTDPELVKQVEQLALEGKFKEALAITLNSDDVD